MTFKEANREQLLEEIEAYRHDCDLFCDSIKESINEYVKINSGSDKTKEDLLKVIDYLWDCYYKLKVM